MTGRVRRGGAGRARGVGSMTFAVGACARSSSQTHMEMIEATESSCRRSGDN